MGPYGVSSLPGLDDGDLAKYHVTSAALTILMFQWGMGSVRSSSCQSLCNIDDWDCVSVMRVKYRVTTRVANKKSEEKCVKSRNFLYVSYVRYSCSD